MTPNPDFIAFARPDIGDEEINAVVETLKSGWLSTGPRTHEFERQFAERVGAKHAIAVNSATAGLHLAVDAIGTEADDYIITSPWTFTATAEVFRYMGAHPLFADVEPDTLNISADRVEEALASGKRVKAIMPVHFAGLPCAMKDLVELAVGSGVRIIEDAAHSFPAQVKTPSMSDPAVIEREIGTIGDMTVFSFYVTKTLATGEGGMITTDDPDLAKRMKVMRLHGISADVWDRYRSNKPKWYYEIIEAGYKYNLPDIASAMGLEQLKKAERFLARRTEIAKTYNEAFADLDALQLPYPGDDTRNHAWHLYVVRLNLDTLTIDRNRFIEELAAKGIGCSVHFIPLHLQPYWRDKYDFKPEDFPVANAQFARTLSLPIYTRMTAAEVTRVIDAVRDTVKAFHR